MTIYRFQQISAQAKRNLKCRNCNKRFTRQQTFRNTVNPFNKNAHGDPKSPEEVREVVQAQADSWQPNDLCTKCESEVNA